jgi:MtN3 and saliva related transmembrane protein
MGEVAGWLSVGLGQLVSWPQVLKLRCERGDGVSLASYGIVLVSMSLFLVHAIAIRDAVSMVSVPVSLIPNAVIAVTLVRRRRLGFSPKASCGTSKQPQEGRSAS